MSVTNLHARLTDLLPLERIHNSIVSSPDPALYMVYITRERSAKS